MGKYQHNGGLIEGVLELGFDEVKYLEGDIGTSAVNVSMDPPARRLTIANRSTSGNLFLRVNNGDATTSTGLVPGDDIKILPGEIFVMDYDCVRVVSFISDSLVHMDGLIGFKGTRVWS